MSHDSEISGRQFVPANCLPRILGLLTVGLGVALLTVGVAGPVVGAPAESPGDTGAVLSGHVSGTDGKPVTDATINLMGPSPGKAKTDEKGFYHIDSIKEAGDYRVMISSKRYVGITRYDQMAVVQLSKDSKVVKDFRLDRSCPLKIMVTDSAGKPVKNVSLYTTSLTAEMPRDVGERSQTDKTGQADVNGIPPSKTQYLITAMRQEYAPGKLVVVLDDPDKERAEKIVLEAGVEVKGIAICSDGKPASGWSVDAQPEWWHCDHQLTGARIDSDGHFTLKHIVPGKYNLSISVPMGEGLSMSSPLTTANLPPDKGLLELRIPRPSPESLVSIVGGVKFKGGKPTRDYRVVARSANDEYESGFIRPEACTFQIRHLPPGVYELRFQSTEFKEKIIKGVKAPSSDLDVELECTSKPKLHGVVVDKATGKALEQFKARVRKLRTLSGPNYVAENRWIDVRNDKGQFELEVTGPGIYTVQVAAEGWAWSISGAINTDTDGDKPARVEMSRGVSLTGLVVNEEGKPISGAKVIPLSRASGNMGKAMTMFVDNEGAVQTVDGRFELEHLSPGAETLKAEHPDYCFAILKDIALTDGTDAKDVRIAMKRGGTIRGHVYDATGRPEANVTLLFQDASGYSGMDDERAGQLATATTDAKGYYEVQHLPEQLCYVRRAEPWRSLGVVRHAIWPQDKKKLTLDFGGQSRITGKLLINGEPLAKRKVQLSGGNAHFGVFKAYAETDENGAFAFLGTPAGKRTLYYLLPGPRQEWAAVKTFETNAGDMDLGSIAVSTCRLTVKLEPAKEATAGGARVRMQEYDSKRTWGNNVGQTAARSGPEAPFVIEDVPPGRHELIVYQEGRLSPRRLVEIKPNQKEMTVDVTLPRGTASLAGTIAQKLCEPGGCQSLKMWTKDRSQMVYISPDEQGKFKVEGLPAGDYLIVSQDTRDAQTLYEVSLKNGEARTLAMDKATCPLPDDKNGVLWIAVYTDEGIPLPGATVTLKGKGGSQLPPSQEHDSTYTFSGPTGDYELKADYPGYSPAVRTIPIKPFVKSGGSREDLTVSVTLSKSGK